MSQEFKVITGGMATENSLKQPKQSMSHEDMLRHFRNLTSSMAGDALRIWSAIYSEFDGTVTYGSMITADAKKGFHPRCGWPEFLEKMRLLEHYLDHLKRLAEGQS